MGESFRQTFANKLVLLFRHVQDTGISSGVNIPLGTHDKETAVKRWVEICSDMMPQFSDMLLEEGYFTVTSGDDDVEKGENGYEVEVMAWKTTNFSTS